MADETTEYKLIDDKIAEMQPIFDRMDEDEKVYLLDPYKLKKLPPYDNKDESDVANVTLNDPLLYANKTMAVIGGATRQTVIEGEKLPDKKTTKIEQFSDDIFYMVNEWLVKRGVISLDSFIIEQICLRGRIVGSSCLQLNADGSVIPNVLPRDARHFVHENDENGMVWGAAISTRSKAQVEKEYNITVTGKAGEVRDFWDSEKNVVFVGKKIVREQPNPYGYPPFVVSICPIGCMFATDDAFEHQGESIFWPNRDLWSEKNRIATILQTLTQQALFANLQKPRARGSVPQKPEQSPFGTDKVLDVEEGLLYQPMPINDIKQATKMAYSILESNLQRGSLTALDYGNLTFPLSAIAYTEITSGRNDVFMPRIQAIALWLQGLTRMMVNQCMSFGKTITLGKPGSQNTYSQSDFDGDYQIKYRFFTQSKEQTIADLSIVNAARGWLPDDYIRREMMKVQDPDGLKTQLEAEQAERIDEVLFLKRRGISILEEAEKYSGFEREKREAEGRVIMQRIKTILRQRKLEGAMTVEGTRTEEKVQPVGKPQGLIPLMAGRGKKQEAEGE